MVDFEKPTFPYAIDVPAEVARLRAHRDQRGIPSRKTGRLLAATWNVANFGSQ